MQSLLQYRRIRLEVQQDLTRARQAQRPNSPPASSGHRGSDGADGDQDLSESASRQGLELPGITVSRPNEKSGRVVFIVGWRDDDPSDPHRWSLRRKWWVMVCCCILMIALTLLTSVEGPTQEEFGAHFGVNDLAASMSTGIFLIGIAVGSLFSGPLSETFGRNAIYFSCMVASLIFIMAKALAPNYGAALAFRFLCAVFSASPMTVSGGSIGDIWTPREIPFGLPVVTICAYSGPILGPVIGAYTPALGYGAEDWISMIILAAALVVVGLGQPETFSPVLLEWRAKHLRDLTGDDRYHAEHASAVSLGPRLLANMYRPFTMTWTEPIILVFSFYLILLYFVLFTFLDGYPYIFTQTYGISLSLTFILWVAMMPGVVVAVAMIPFLYHLTKKVAARSAAEGKELQPEVSLYWGMAGASILMPISLFWMAWTCYVSFYRRRVFHAHASANAKLQRDISIWSPIVASAFFGYALVCIFTTTYMYLIFVYLEYAASALTFATFSRYIISGALTPASVVMYENIGPHWSLTISAIVATFMAPVPFVLYTYGHRVRAMSKFAQSKG